MGTLIAYACAFSFFVVVLKLDWDYWENRGSLRRKLREGVVMMVHCSFSHHIVSLYMHTLAGHCWFVLFTLLRGRSRSSTFFVRLEASLLSGAGVREGRSQD